jgi:hypothetical protein
VLDAIGQLEDAQRAALEEMEPWLAKTFASSGTWQEIVARQMEFSEQVPDKIRGFWLGYLDHAKALNRSVHPSEFVAEFIGQNFPDIAPPTLDVH